MNLFATTLRRGAVGTLGACAVGAVVAATVALPVANAAPCSASGFSSVSSGVLASAGTYLDAHQGANDVLTAAASQSPDDARTSVRGYFIGHPGEFLDLQRIAQPLKDLKNQCGVSISPSQLATLFDELQ
jgi:hemophore-related protein